MPIAFVRKTRDFYNTSGISFILIGCFDLCCSRQLKSAPSQNKFKHKITSYTVPRILSLDFLIINLINLVESRKYVFESCFSTLLSQKLLFQSSEGYWYSRFRCKGSDLFIRLTGCLSRIRAWTLKTIGIYTEKPKTTKVLQVSYDEETTCHYKHDTICLHVLSILSCMTNVFYFTIHHQTQWIVVNCSESAGLKRVT